MRLKISVVIKLSVYLLLAFVFFTDCTADVECHALDAGCSDSAAFLWIYRLNDTSGITAKSPDSLVGLKLWLKADSLQLADTNSVTNWTDSSGTGNDVIPGTAPVFNSNIVNGLPVVTFSGANRLLKTSPVGVDDQNHSIFSVYKRTTFGVAGNVVFATNLYTYGFSVNDTSNPCGDGACIEGINAITPTMGFLIHYADFEPTVRSQILINGTLDSIQRPPPILSGVTDFYIGDNSTSTNPFNGQIAEIIYYNSILADADRQGVECYLANKYGITLKQACKK